MRTALVHVVVGLAVVGCSAPSTPVAAPVATAGSSTAGSATAGSSTSGSSGALPGATPASATRDPAPPTFRLPGDVVPVRYRLDQLIVPGHARVQGDIQIDATVKRPTRVVWLNARDIDVQHATIDGHPARVIAGGDNFVGIAADRELAPGAATIDVAYIARIDSDKSRGIYSEREGKDDYVYTFFEAIDARRAFPCFDEPSYKVPWTLVFHVRKTDVARGNAPIVREVDEPAGMKRVELAESKPIPSYLVAFVVGPFDVIDDGVAGRAKTPVAFIVPKGRSGELAYAKAITPKVVTALEDYFDMDYPYGKLDVAVVPRYWGTMEHPGIVAMGQPLTLIRPDQATRSRKQGYTNILAHELSHYWFGDFVTLAWWDDVWLNEALGEWSDMNITDAVAPEWHFRDERVELATDSMRADETLAAKPIHHDVTTTEGIEAAFDNEIAYGKGSSVLRAAEALVGPEKFRAFIRTYVRAHAWGNATAKDFFGDMRAQLGDPVADMLTTYVERPGVPLVTIHTDCTAKKPRIVIDESRRSLPAGVQDPDPKPWHVPVCVRYGDLHHAERACGTDAIETAFCPTWVIANADANGYYRSVVERPGALPPVAKPTLAERMMMFSDLRATVDRAGIGIDVLLATIPALVDDPEPRAARWAIEASDLRFDGLDEALYQAARTWLVHTYTPRALALGWHRGPKDSDELHHLRRTLLRMVGRFDPVLRAQAEKLADRWLTDRSGIEDDLVDSVLAAAAYSGDAARFDRILAAAKAPRDRTERQRLLTALGTFIDPALAKRGLALTLSSDFDLRESLPLLETLVRQHETRDLALGFVTEHIDELLAHMRGDEAGWFLGFLARSGCDPTRRAAIATLITPRAAKFDGAQNAVAQGLEQADRCIAETAREKPALEKFFGAHR